MMRMGNFIFITPTRGDMRVETVYCVDECRKHMGYHIPWELIIGGALMTKQFDYCAAAFLREHTEDYMIILGSDMTFKPADIEKLVQAAEERP